MSLATFLVAVVIIGLIWYLIITYAPIPQPGKLIVNVAFVIVFILLLLQLVGLGDFNLRLK